MIAAHARCTAQLSSSTPPPSTRLALRHTVGSPLGMRAETGVHGRLFLILVCFSVWPAHRADAFGDATAVEIVSLDVGRGESQARTVAERLAWEVRKRSSVEPILEPGRARLEKAALFRSPFAYWRGSEEFLWS